MPHPQKAALSIRLPIGLYEQLRRASRDNLRSLNAEIVRRLQASTDRPAGRGR